MKNLNYKEYYKRHLPHYQPENGYFFITYRLAFSLPEHIVEKLKIEKKHFENKTKDMSNKEKNKYAESYYENIFLFMDDYFDKCGMENNKSGTESRPTFTLTNDKIANVIIDSWLFFHNKRYELICLTVMSNHVHCIIKPLKNENGNVYSLSKILYSHKRFTAFEINKVLDQKGKFWQDESFDHYVRDENDLRRKIIYVLNNPVKVGLVDDYKNWKYYWFNDRFVI